MATEEEHLRQFDRNQATAERLQQAGDYDWSIVALFYSSLHLVQSYLLSKNVIVRSHWQRDRQILAVAELRPVIWPYRNLRVHSEQARYECRHYSREEFTTIRTGVFAEIVSHVQGLRGMN